MNVHKGMKAYAKLLWILLPWAIVLIPVKIALNFFFDIPSEIDLLIMFVLAVIVTIFAVKLYNKKYKK